MIDIDEILDFEDLNEENMVSRITKNVNEINRLGDKVKNGLNHCKLQFGVGLLLLIFGMPMWSYITLFSICFLTFVITSSFYSDRKNMMVKYSNLLMELKRKKILNKENKDLVKEIDIKFLWFENN
jgi:hypothetical protein